MTESGPCTAVSAGRTFKLTPGRWDSQQVKDGVYRLTVTAWDTAGNHSSASQVFQVHNRSSWLGG